MFMAYMVYTHEKLDINERSGFWKYIIAKLFRCHGCEICK
ncbi:pX64R [African swine fever virus]|nr:pX64R [African swine fever virus]